MAVQAHRRGFNCKILIGEELSYETLTFESDRYRGSGGISGEARGLGFAPAFRHRLTGELFPARDDQGRPAAVHLLGGIPECYVTRRDTRTGAVLAVCADIEAGFVRGDCFYTRDEATRRP